MIVEVWMAIPKPIRWVLSWVIILGGQLLILLIIVATFSS